MDFNFIERASDTPFVEKIWRTESHEHGAFTSFATSQWEMVVVKYEGETTLAIRGPETKASRVEYPPGVEFFGMIFKLGTFMPHLPIQKLMDRQDMSLPEATSGRFWLHGSAWQFPDFENADFFLDRLVREGLLMHDPIVDAALKDQLHDLSLRSLQRRFVQATGLTQKTILQIERARNAALMLAQGVSILDTTHSFGYYDQAHLTNSLTRFVGHTPTQLAEQTPLQGTQLWKLD